MTYVTASTCEIMAEYTSVEYSTEFLIMNCDYSLNRLSQLYHGI